MKGRQEKRCGRQRGCACRDDAALRQAVVDAVRVMRGGERRLTCAQALALAEQFDAKPACIGEICDAEGIKLRRCQLGCF
jgi:hypothetical protein